MPKKLIIVIPALNPNQQLIDLINKLESFFDEYNLILVDDGSTAGLDIFERCKQYKNITVLKHDKNEGKGQALKTAYSYIKANYTDCVVITADSDGQHKPEDIKKVYDFYLINEGAFILGSRKFDCEVPKKSTCGNNISRALLRIVLNKYLHDTQTGLRAFGDNLLDFMIGIKGKRYEYEMNVINEIVRQSIPVKEVTIQTIYIENNKSSHFRPLRDFLRIAFSILKYAVPLVISFILNVIVVSIAGITRLVWISANTALSYVILNWLGLFFGNKTIFKNGKKLLRHIFYFLIWEAILILLCLAMSFSLWATVLANFIAIVIFGLLNCFWIKKDQLFP